MSLFVPVPQNHILTSGANSALTWTNAVSVSSMNVSSLGASALSVSTLTTSTSITSASLASSTLVTSSITANSVGYSTLSGSTINSTRLNYSSITGSSISTNSMTLSLTNVSTQNTQIYQVATTNPTTSYTAIQASHVSTGTTNNALVLNPSGGNVGVGTTAPTASLHIKNATSALRITGGLSNSSARPAQTAIPGAYEIRGSGLSDASDDGFLRLSAGGGSSTPSYIDLSGYSTVPDMVNTLTFGSGGVERMRILANGNVGVGTTAPAATLDVAGTVRGSIFTTQYVTVGAFSSNNTFTIVIPYPATYLFSVMSNNANVNNGSGDNFVKAFGFIQIGPSGVLLTTFLQTMGVGINSYTPGTQTLSYNIGNGSQTINSGGTVNVSVTRVV